MPQQANIVNYPQKIVVVSPGKSIKVIGGVEGPQGPQGPAGPITSLGGLTNVDETGVANGDGLIYNLSSGLWEPVDVALASEISDFLTSTEIASLYLPLAGGVVSGEVEANTMYITGGNDVGPDTDVDNPLNIGAGTGLNLALDGNEIMFRNNGTQYLTIFGNAISTPTGDLTLSATASGADVILDGDTFVDFKINGTRDMFLAANKLELSAGTDLVMNSDVRDKIFMYGAGSNYSFGIASSSMTYKTHRYHRFYEAADLTGQIYMDMDSNPRIYVENDSGSDFIYFYADTSWIRVQGTQNLYCNQSMRPSGLHSYTDGTIGAPAWSWHNDANTGFYRVNNGTMEWSSNGTRVIWANNTSLFAPGVYNSTTTTAANVNVLDNNGYLRRVSSSLRVKKDIEPLEDSYADDVLNMSPIWFRSAIPTDNPDYSHYGFAAEDVASIDPRLAHFEPTPGCDCEPPVTLPFCGQCDDGVLTSVVDDAENEGQKIVETTCQCQILDVQPTHVLHRPECMRPSGVQYERLTPALVNIAKRQRSQIQSLESRLAAVEAVLA